MTPDPDLIHEYQRAVEIVTALANQRVETRIQNIEAVIMTTNEDIYSAFYRALHGLWQFSPAARRLALRLGILDQITEA